MEAVLGEALQQPEALLLSEAPPEMLLLAEDCSEALWLPLLEAAAEELLDTLAERLPRPPEVRLGAEDMLVEAVVEAEERWEAMLLLLPPPASPLLELAAAENEPEAAEKLEEALLVLQTL